MPRLTDNDKHIGSRITYGKTERSTIRFIYTTDVHEDERSGHNALYISLLGTVIRIILPEIIKPVQQKIQAKWDEATVKRLGRDHYFVYFDREYGFSKYENHFQIFYGVQSDGHWAWPSGAKEKRKGFFVPWEDYRLIRNEMYDGNMNLAWKETFKRDKDKLPFGDRYDIMQTMPRQAFKIKDYDDAEIICDVHVEHRTWRRGTGWFKWVSLFMKGIDRRSIELNFRKEVGPRKGEWKGGLMGMGFNMLPDETIEQAFKRWCEQTRTKKDRHLKPVTYLGPVTE